MKNILQEFSRYLGVGGLAFVTDFSLLAGLTSLLNMNYLLATLLAFLAGSWVNYILSICWVFKHRALTNQYTEFSIFVLVGVLTLCLSMVCMSFLVQWLGIHLLMAKCITTSLTLVTNFAGRRILLFRQPELKQKLLVSSN